jgi:hypothetical protein
MKLENMQMVLVRVVYEREKERSYVIVVVLIEK